MSNKIVLILGRFQPFHLGHLNIVQKYSKQGFFIKVGIGSSKNWHEKKNPFTFKERREMIIKSLKECNIIKYKIYEVPDIPNDKKYFKYVSEIVGHYDILFTGNKHVKSLFANKGTEIHYINENEDRYKNISATEIRKKLITNSKSMDLPFAVSNYLKNIRTKERLKEIYSPSKKVHYLLRENHLTISSAESCTGGAIARTLISYSGASDFFMTGFVVYSKSSKMKYLHISQLMMEKYGAISPEMTMLMSEQIKSIAKTDYSIATTGYADPSDKHAGMVFISIHSPFRNYIKKIDLRHLNNRNKIIDHATKQAINFLYAVLKKELVRK
jgi:nicotinamide-nucleotide adenylyltransferase